MIALAEPRLTERVYDPACGTAGFLISTFDYIKKRSPRTKEVLKALRERTVWGRELTNNAKIAKMNMILTGDGHANIRQIDSLSEPVKGEYDVVLSNIPYGQTTDHGGLYPVPSNNGDSVFLQHAFLSLRQSPESRAAVVIPEGVLFAKPMVKLRQFLLSQCRVTAVISLPRGVFRPYVKNNKTDIIVFSPDPTGTKSVWFYDLTADGYDLDSDFRRPVAQNDIPDLLSKWVSKTESRKSWLVPIEKIQANKWRLIAKEYSPYKNVLTTTFPPCRLGSVATENKASFTVDNATEYALLTARWYGGGLVARERLMGAVMKVKDQKVAHSGQLLVAQIDAKSGGYGVVPPELDGSIVSSHYYLFDVDKKKIRPAFLDYVLRFGPYELLFGNIVSGTTNYADVRAEDLLEVELPLPTLEDQDRLVADIESQLAIKSAAERTLELMDAAGIDTRSFPVEPRMRLRDVARMNPTYQLTANSREFFVEMAALNEKTGALAFANRAGTDGGLSRFREGDILFARMTPCTENGKVAVARGLGEETGLGSTEFVVLTPDTSKVTPEWLYFYLLSRQVRERAAESMTGTTGRERVPDSFFEELEVPVPPPSEQERLVADFRHHIHARLGVDEARDQADRAIRAIVATVCGSVTTGEPPESPR